jgi:ribonuclease BN (tRNA processing enzyme)
MEGTGEATGQTGTLDAARMANEASAGTLVLTHTGPNLARPGSLEKAVADISRIFDGKILFGQELMSYNLW